MSRPSSHDRRPAGWPCVLKVGLPTAPRCKRSFDTAVGLDTHQITCRHFAQDDSSLAGLAGRIAEKKARKRRRIEEQVLDDSQQMDTRPDITAHPNSTSPVLQSAPLPPRDPSPQGRGRRKKRPTWKVLEQLPQPPTAISGVARDTPTRSDTPDDPSVPDKSLPERASESPIWCMVRTALNAFGLYREYHTLPTHSPDDILSLEDVSYAALSSNSTQTSRLAPSVADDITVVSPVNASAPTSGPFKNISIFRLMNWMWTGSAAKSVAELNRLVHITPYFSLRGLPEITYAGTQRTQL
ncbi:hypothetical protein FA95DRAFT_1576885 [Auriscalpium vulgare]|uniref:Uncharacterized protein n=1 Tax=Auriscalpium vulgare TaxID=40419 RepID=A0ACB8R8S1_9AGAM|nr:hypothetical protein FA95DRAFT_1576885 [Auriscalpium vulgare]